MIRIFVENFQIDNYILVIATCDNVSNLNENIYSAKGVHIFPNVFQLPELTKVFFVIQFFDNKKLFHTECIFSRKLKF